MQEFTRKILFFAAVLAAATLARADKIMLKDGNVLQGRTIRQSDGYWIKLEDGTTQTIPSEQIRSVEKTTTPEAAPSAPGPGSTSIAPATPAPSSTASLSGVKRRADAVRAPMSAVAIWQQFIDSKPAPGDADLKTAHEQLAQWQKLADAGALKIKGKWISGDELKRTTDKLKELMKEHVELLRQNQTLAAVKKLEEAYAIYPDSYHITFELGYVSMLEHDQDKAIRYFDETLKIQPGLAAATGNIGLCLIGKKKIMEGVLKLQQAAQQGDTPELSHDLSLALSRVPPEQRNSERLKPAAATASLLESKYASIPPKTFDSERYVLLEMTMIPSASAEGPKMWSGSGFLINEEGIILTNRHVAKDAKTLMITLDGGAQTTADVVVIDDEQDLALLKISPESSKHLFVKLSPSKTPAAGADCTVMGFPLADRLGANIKVTRGIVTGVQSEGLEPDVLVDAKVNPGNSGGPMLNKNGDVMAIVSMKTRSNSTEDTYGIGISAGLIRRFLDKNHISVPKADAKEAALSTEEIAAKTRPAVVMIFATQ